MGVLGEVEVVRKWISDILEKQENTDPTDTPAFTSEEVPLQTKKIESLVSRLSRKPKPKPVAEKEEQDATEEKIDDEDVVDDKAEEDESEQEVEKETSESTSDETAEPDSEDEL